MELVQMGARWYDPQIGRWLSPDTIIPDPTNPQSLNRYAYALGNPVKYRDPSGHDVDCSIGESGCQQRVAVEKLWDQQTPPANDRHAAEESFLHYLNDPGYFAALYADSGAWSASQEAANLEVFANYSQLHTTAGQLIWNVVADTYGIDAADNLKAAAMRSGLEGETGTGSGITVLGAASVPVVAGEAGRFGDLAGRGVAGDDLTPHHMPQAALRFTSRENGGAIVITRGEHLQTQSYGKVVNQGLSFRDALAADIRDLRSIVGNKYNTGVRALIEYYETNFPGLIGKK